MTPGARWRFRRDLVIALAHRAGCSQRFLGDVFDLSKTAVGGIIRRVEALGAASETDRPDGDDGPHAARRCARRPAGKSATPRPERVDARGR